MSFLAPVGLAALLLLPVIVAIHLWRIRYRRQTISSTLLWSRVLSESPLRRPRRLPTRYLLLLLELAALACGAVALARPSVAATTGRHLVVAVDSSLLMTATDTAPNRLARAKTQVRALVDGLGAGDTMTLVDAGTTPRVLAASSDHTVLRRALEKITDGAGASSLAGDGPLLAGLVAANGPHTTAYLFAPYGTDGATLAALRRGVPHLHTRIVGTSGDDRAVTGLTVSCLAGKKPSCEAYARLVNTGVRAVTTQITATVDGATVTQYLALPADGTRDVGLPLPAGAHTVELSLAGHDPLAADDTAWAVVPRAVHRVVLLATDDPTSPLAQALRAIPNVTLRVTTPDDNALNTEAARADLTVLDATDASIVPPGNLLFVNPSGGNGFFAASSHSIVAPGVTATDQASALLRAVDLESLVISTATRVALPAWAHVDIASDGGPLLFDGTTGGRRVAVLTFDPRPDAATDSSNLATLLAFPTLLQNLVDTLAPPPTTGATAGGIAAVPLTRQAPAILTSAGGKAAELPSSGDLAALPALHPGLYNVTDATGGGAQNIAVNAASAMGPATTAGQAGTSPQVPQVGPLPNISIPTPPWEGWALFAILALLFLSGEWWYYVRNT